MKQLKQLKKSFYDQSKKHEPNTSVHQGFTCDGCQVYPIVGVRYRCNECPDFDFCEICEEKKKEMNMGMQ